MLNGRDYISRLLAFLTHSFSCDRQRHKWGQGLFGAGALPLADPESSSSQVGSEEGPTAREGQRLITFAEPA